MSKIAEKSYVHGGATKPLIASAVGELFDEAVRAHGDALALVVRHQGIRWRYFQLAEEVEKSAAGLISLGLVPGDRVALWAQLRRMDSCSVCNS